MTLLILRGHRFVLELSMKRVKGGGWKSPFKRSSFSMVRDQGNGQISAGVCMFCFSIIKKFSGTNVSEAHTAVHTQLGRNLQR